MSSDKTSQYYVPSVDQTGEVRADVATALHDARKVEAAITRLFEHGLCGDRTTDAANRCCASLIEYLVQLEVRVQNR